MSNYKKLLEATVEIIRQASEIVKSEDFTVEEKSVKEDILTSADIGVQNFLCEKLKKLLPQSGFLCEEKHMSDLKHDYVWVIDPIDGTTNYSRNIDECAISVALLYNRKPVIGVVYAPLKDYLFTATDGGGAQLNGKNLRVSEKAFENSLICTAMSLYNKSYAKACSDIIFETYMQCNDIRRFGSCALELCYLAAGKCDLYFEIRVFPWDYSAAYLVLKEAGGVLKGFNGEELTYDKPTVLIGANNFKNFSKLNAIVNKYLKSVPYSEEL